MPHDYRKLLSAVVKAQRNIARGGTYVAYMQALAAAEVALMEPEQLGGIDMDKRAWVRAAKADPPTLPDPPRPASESPDDLKLVRERANG